jgi:hypothetical protein
MRHPRAITAALLAVMLQLTAGLAAAAQVVVCRTPSGHVAIESELNDCCPGGGDRLHELSSNACDGCVDTPLFQAGIASVGKVTLGAVAVSPWSVSPPAGHSALRFPLAPPTGASRRGRTVILLI